MSKYISEFTSIIGTNYKIEIDTEKGSNNDFFTLAGTPIVTSMDSDGKTMYAPIKSVGATITILTETLPFDIYSGNSIGTKITFTDTTNNKIKFIGYVTPCAYSQGFDRQKEAIEIECIDGIAVLKDLPYRTNNKDIKTFLQIIFNCLKRSNCFRYLYINDNVQFTSTGTESILEKIRITEQNFFDKKDYETQSDDDVAMTCYDVLFEIMQYMGYTLIADGQDVYILDYDAIIKNRTKYFRYDITGDSLTKYTVVNLSSNYHIIGESYAENGTKIELSEIFNKLTIKDEFNEIDSLTDGLDNSKNYTNITANYDNTLKMWFQTDSRFLESEVFTEKNKNGEDESFFVTIQKADDGKIFFVLGKFYKNPLITCYHYSHNNGNPTLNQSVFEPMMYSKLWSQKGANIVGLYTKKIESKQYNEWRVNYPANWNGMTIQQKLDSFAKLSNLADMKNKKLVRYILCLNQDTNHIEHDNVRNYPFFKITKDIPTVFGGDGGYLVIQGSLIRHYQYNAPFPQNGECYRHKDEKKTSIYANEGYIWARLKWGKYYWKSEGGYNDNGEWVTTPSDFKIFYGNPTKETQVDEWQDKDVSFYNNCGAIWGVSDENGYYVPVPEDNNLTGSIELTIYANKDTKGKWARNNKKDKKNSYNGFKPKVMLYKGIDIKVGYSDDAMNEDAANSDTYYTNDSSTQDNINKAEDVKMKICTYDNKTPSYSTPDFLNSKGESEYIEKLYNLSTGYQLRQEEHLLIKIISQYINPKVVFEANLKDSLNILPYTVLTDKTLTNRKFIVDKKDVDFRFNKAKISMIEKVNKYETLD